MFFDSVLITALLLAVAVLGMVFVFWVFKNVGNKDLTKREAIGLIVITIVVILLGIFHSGYHE